MSPLNDAALEACSTVAGVGVCLHAAIGEHTGAVRKGRRKRIEAAEQHLHKLMREAREALDAWENEST